MLLVFFLLEHSPRIELGLQDYKSSVITTIRRVPCKLLYVFECGTLDSNEEHKNLQFFALPIGASATICCPPKSRTSLLGTKIRCNTDIREGNIFPYIRFLRGNKKVTVFRRDLLTVTFRRMGASKKVLNNFGQVAQESVLTLPTVFLHL